MQAGGIQQGNTLAVAKSAMTSTNSVVSVMTTDILEGKRRHDGEENEGNNSKRWNTFDPPNETMDLMKRMFAEIVDIKTIVGAIQTENAEWEQRVKVIEDDMVEVKSSLEMAHNLISDGNQRKGNKVS